MCLLCLQSSSTSQSPSNEIDVPGITIRGVSHSQAHCFVCGLEKRNRIPVTAIQNMFDAHGLYIPQHNRACTTHFTNGLFNEIAITLIIQKTSDIHLNQETTLEYMKVLRMRQENEPVSSKSMTFDEVRNLPEKYYKIFLGVSKSEFLHLVDCVKPHMRCSSNRSIHDAVGMYLMFLRMVYPQEVNIKLIF